MDINQLRELIAPFIQTFSTLLVSGVAVSVVTQLLKLDWFPAAVSRFPRLTSAVLSVVASLVCIYLSGINFVFVTVLDYLGFIVGTAILAAATYKAVLRGTVPGKDSQNARF